VRDVAKLIERLRAAGELDAVRLIEKDQHARRHGAWRPPRAEDDLRPSPVFPIWRIKFRRQNMTKRMRALRGSFAIAFEKAAAQPGKMGALTVLYTWAEEALRSKSEGFTPSVEREIREMAKEGRSAYAIAKELNISEPAVRRRIGAVTRRGERVWDELLKVWLRESLDPPGHENKPEEGGGL
jgi:hypothetical protein